MFVGVEPGEVSELERNGVRAAAAVQVWTSSVDRQSVEIAAELLDSRIRLAEKTEAQVEVEYENPLFLNPGNATQLVLDLEAKGP